MDKFKDIDNAALDALFAEKHAAFVALRDKESPSDTDLEDAEALATDLDEIVTERDQRAAAATEREERFAALKNKTFGSAQSEDEGEDEEEDEEDEPADEADESTEADAVAEADAADAPVEVNAAAKPVKAARKSLGSIAAKTKRPEVDRKAEPRLSIVASAGVPDFESGQRLNGIAEISDAVVARMGGFAPPQGDGTKVDLQKFGVAKIATEFPEDLVIDRGSDDFSVVERAADESRLESASGRGSLVAAGGWCAPSETLYDLASDESLEGILSLPEVQVRRGGIRYTEGPQFADFYAEAGFIQTEAQAIAGTTKPCYEVDCPTFTEVRLDAVGICIKVPILTNAAWPELVQRFTSGSLIAHQHMVNANVIGRMVTLSGAARVFTGMGSTVADTLEALEIVAMQRRQSQRLALNRTMEVVVPFWTRGAHRADLGRRTGQDTPVTDQQIDAHFSAQNLRVSYVYDWQVFDATAEAYPATYQALVYPAGTFVKGTSAVINLSAVYDAASLATNTYTGLFMEEGLLVAKRQYGSDLVTLPICNAGRTGAANFTCGV